MDRAQRISQFWNWLPTFRMVAETQHLPTAAAHLHVSASAISRTIRLLEEDVGKPLFRRVGKRLELNPEGQKLLSAVSHAMRRIDDALQDLHDAEFEGRVRVVSGGAITKHCVLPALSTLQEKYPSLVFELLTHPPSAFSEHLFRGSVDLVFSLQAIRIPGLSCEVVGEQSSGIYCGTSHPFYKKSPSFDALGDFAFVAPPSDRWGNSPEGWPAEQKRHVALHIEQMHIGVDACRSGRFLAVLPDVVGQAESHLKLWRIPLNVVKPAPVFCIHRDGEEMPPAILATLHEIRKRLGALSVSDYS